MLKIVLLQILALTICSNVAVGDQSRPEKKVSVFTNFSESDAAAQSLVKVFTEALENDKPKGVIIKYEYFWSAGSIDDAKLYAKSVISSRPDVIFAATTPVVRALLQETKTIPIVFATVADPVGSGFVDNLAVPGKNVTGFINSEGTLAGKWVQYLKELLPGISCVSMMYNPITAPYYKYYISPFEETARLKNMTSILSPVANERDIENSINTLSINKCGLILMNDSFNYIHRKIISSTSERYGIPVMAYNKATTQDEALVAYGPEEADAYKKAAGYVRKIIEGTEVGKLPVQLNTHFYLSINMKKAKKLGILVPASFLSSVDEEVD
ncbi:ABC transporter substrate-binding protein [Methylobacterium sp. CM6246]